ncbi:MAG TPA: SRPBCC family protein [Variovorax sp.]|nr:SRPBCC family protein [Variovorax sp.]
MTTIPFSARRGAVRLLLAVALLTLHAPLPAQEVLIETAGKGELITVTASAEMQVDARTVWGAISDYDHLAEFIPDMHSSRVIQREGDKVLVEQTGQIGFLVFQQPVEVRLEVHESPQRRIAAHAVGGNLKEMEGLYALESLPSGAVRLTYSGRLVPDFAVPPVIGRLVVRNLLSKQLTALVHEIMRRDLAARAAPQAQ